MTGGPVNGGPVVGGPGGSSTWLEEALVDLGNHLDGPDGLQIVERAAAVIRADADAGVGLAGGRRPPRSRWQRLRRRRLAVALVLVLAALGGSLTPAVAGWLGLRGARVHQGPLPVPPESVGRAFDLGRAVTMTEAAAVAGFEPVVPALLGPPSEVWVDSRTIPPIVWLVYSDGPLVSELQGRLAAEPVFQKFAGPNTRVEELTVDGRSALWVEGVHEVAVQTANGILLESLRLSDSALLVERGNLTVRIETTAGREEAVRIARSLP